MLLYFSVPKQTWEGTVNILLERSSRTFIVKKIMVNKSEVEK